MSDGPSQSPALPRLVFDPAQFADSLSAARALHAMGIRPVCCHIGAKAPFMPGWENVAPDAVLRIVEETPAVNVGALLGHPATRLLDIDLDTHGARLIVPRLLERFVGECPRYGRSGREPGHYLVQAAEEDAGPTIQWGLSEKEAEALGIKSEGERKQKRMIAELRRKGAQSVVPGSRFADGDVVAWARGGEVPRVSGAELERLVALGAALAVLLFKYPRTQGDRNEVYLALTGALVACEWLDDEDVEFCADLVSELAGDEKRKGRAADTRAKMESGEDYWGLPKLCELLGIAAVEKTLRKWITWGQARKGRKRDRSQAGAPPADAILLSEERLIQEIEESEAALVKAGAPIYVRGGELSRILRLDRKERDKDGVTRAQGARIIVSADGHWLNQQMARASKYSRFDKSTGEFIYTRPRLELAEHLRARAGDGTPFPTLRSVYDAPTIRADGSLLQTPGFDEATGILYEPSLDYPPIPDNPTKRDALRALHELIAPFRLFPFVTDAPGERALRSASFAVVLSGVLCIVARDAMRTVPLHLDDAPAAGTGKSKKTEAVSVIGTGLAPAIIDHGPDAEEFEKRLGSAMLKGDRVVVIDNVDGPFGGTFVCGLLTAENVAVRVLGKSKNVVLPNNFVLFANGNNITPVGDLPRRSVVSRIDSGEENPDERSFDFDPATLALERRARLVVAALTILRAFHVAGRPLPSDFKPMGSFEEYSLVRGALRWLGLADPLATRERLRSNDPEREALTELLSLWYQRFDSAALTTAELKDALQNDFTSPLFQLLTGGRPVFSTQSVGNRLRKHVGRRVGGFMLCKGAAVDNTTAWRVVNHGGKPGEQLELPDYSERMVKP